MEIDFLTLADGAQVVGDKLYMLGGGWSFVRAPAYPVAHPMAVAVGFSVDWMETTGRHEFRIALQNEDNGGQKLAEIAGQFETRRPAGMPAGSAQKVILAFSIQPVLEKPGRYVVNLMLDGHDVKRQAFVAATLQPQAMPPPSVAPADSR